MSTDRRALFLETIHHLRTTGEVVLHAQLLHPTDAEAEDVTHHLESEYDAETLEYPHSPPPFHPEAARWAALTLYRAAQLLLYRAHAETDLPALFPACPAAPSPAAILSADLCLRFLPAVADAIARIDATDALLPILEAHLATWHYSAIGYKPLAAAMTEPDYAEAILADPCLRTLYTDRIIRRRDLSRAASPVLAPGLRAALGAVSSELWPGGPASIKV